MVKEQLYIATDAKLFLNFTFTNKLKTCSLRINTLIKTDVTHRHTTPGSSRKGRLKPDTKQL